MTAWFLVKTRNCRLDSIAVYYDAEVANRAYVAQERILGFANDEYRVCLFSANSLNALLTTHANWFDVDPMASHNRLLAMLGEVPARSSTDSSES